MFFKLNIVVVKHYSNFCFNKSKLNMQNCVMIETAKKT